MKKFIRCLIFPLIACLCFGFVACDDTQSENKNSNSSEPAETIELATTTLGEVEFENADTVEIDNENNNYTISGTINAMSESQVIAFGVESVTHAVVVKYTFDKEKTISSFEIKGNTTKVYADSEDVENYVGSITDLLDSEDGEDAYVYLVLSANTKEYTLKSTYSDNTTSEITLKIKATLATAEAE